MATYEDYTGKTDLTLDEDYELIGNDPSDATETGYWKVTLDNFLKWTIGHTLLGEMDLSGVSTYTATDYLIGSNAAGDDNIKITMGNLVSIMKTKLEEAIGGLDLDAMFDSNGNHILKVRQSAIASLTDSTGGTGGADLAGYTIAALIDSTGGSTPDTVLNAVGDTSTVDQSVVLNDNFAKIAVALNAIASALNGDNDVSSINDKIDAVLDTLRPTKHGLIGA